MTLDTQAWKRYTVHSFTVTMPSINTPTLQILEYARGSAVARQSFHNDDVDAAMTWLRERVEVQLAEVRAALLSKREHLLAEAGKIGDLL